jgi:transcriptional regulator with XRE-family HTH domain
LLDATEFGKKLRELIAKNNLRQRQLAEELGVSPSILSNYITGKNIPEMDFLAKCTKKFALRDKELVDFFNSAFLTAGTNNHKIIVDTQFLGSKQIEILAKFLTVLIFYPTMIGKDDLKKYYAFLEEKTEFHPSD